MSDKRIVIKLLPGGEIECFPPKGIVVEIQNYEKDPKECKKDVFIYMPRDLG
jgi:hypothetical protein